jgi:hypothetical protein
MWCVPTLGARDTERWAERGNKCISALPERRPLSPMNTCGQTATLSSGTFDGGRQHGCVLSATSNGTMRGRQKHKTWATFQETQ